MGSGEEAGEGYKIAVRVTIKTINLSPYANPAKDFVAIILPVELQKNNRKDF